MTYYTTKCCKIAEYKLKVAQDVPMGYFYFTNTNGHLNSNLQTKS